MHNDERTQIELNKCLFLPFGVHCAVSRVFLKRITMLARRRFSWNFNNLLGVKFKYVNTETKVSGGRAYENLFLFVSTADLDNYLKQLFITKFITKNRRQINTAREFQSQWKI